MKDKKIPIKILISGNRACGKSVMAQYLADVFANLGAEVINNDPDLERKSVAKYNREYYRNVEKQFNKQKITITVKNVACKNEKDFDKQLQYAKEYLKKWGE